MNLTSNLIIFVADPSHNLPLLHLYLYNLIALTFFFAPFYFWASFGDKIEASGGLKKSLYFLQGFACSDNKPLLFTRPAAPRCALFYFALFYYITAHTLCLSICMRLFAVAVALLSNFLSMQG